MGLKIPRSKGRAGSIPASGTKQIRGLHEILHAGPLFLLRNSESCSAIPRLAPLLAFCQSTKIQDIPATAKPLAPHARRHMATPLNIAAFSGARCNRIAIDAHSVVGAARDLDQATAAKLGPSPG